MVDRLRDGPILPCEGDKREQKTLPARAGRPSRATLADQEPGPGGAAEGRVRPGGQGEPVVADVLVREG
jgi:hypothetical protein